MNDFDENVLQQDEEEGFPWQDVLELTKAVLSDYKQFWRRYHKRSRS